LGSGTCFEESLRLLVGGKMLKKNEQLKMGVIGTSFLENEKRIPLFPEHLDRIDGNIRKLISFESGYGKDFFITDDIILSKGYNVASREELLKKSDVVILPKPTSEDMKQMKSGSILWGWAHCVQQKDIASVAISNKLTLLTWESMFQWRSNGEKSTHIFYRNNELAGYAGVIHALTLAGIDGYYGPRRKVVVFSYGAVSAGAIYALNRHGFNNITVFTQRPSFLVANKNPDVYYETMAKNDKGEVVARFENGDEKNLIDELKDADIVVNGILQDVNNPFMYIREEQVGKIKDGQLIIDISCDKGMGFCFATPTTFDDPVIKVEDRILYYSVDHTPSYLWNAASREISKTLVPFLNSVINGADSIKENIILKNAIEIENGVVLNKNIIKFQKRHAKYPYDFE
jgi:alanine dehydrogenase